MKIETKFEINNLVKRKFDSDYENSRCCLEVMEIISQTCYAGTQVFYLCRSIILNKQFEHEYKKEGAFKWVILHNVSQEENNLGWRKYREDELIEAPNEIIDIILNN